MTPESVLTLGREAMHLTLMVSAPMLVVALAVGLLVSIFQAATQINESTLSFIPKLLAVFLTIALAGSWMLAQLTDYTRQLFTNLPLLVS
ncbi:MAG: flagellar biosynthesis protein FliQ [Pseudomonadota bacterium]|nr:flagellar biosynthesis protein FliQ [Pseudomonadota bacterium]